MSGILRLESLTKGNTLRQGDLTLLKYRLFDADGDKLDISGKSATVRLMKNDFTFIAYEKEGLTVAPNDTISFSVNKVLPGGLYHLEVIVDDKYIFPSRDDEGKFNVDKSSLGADVTIVEATGVEAVARKATGMMKQDEEFIDGMIANVISDTNVGNIETYYNQFNEAIDDFTDLKPKALTAISKSDDALTKSQNALNVANGIDAKATNALDLSESADTLSKSVQNQFNQVVIDGDSSVEAAQARVDASGQTNATLKDRLDKEYNEVTTQLAQIAINVNNYKHLVVDNDWTLAIQTALDTKKPIKLPQKEMEYVITDSLRLYEGSIIIGDYSQGNYIYDSTTRINFKTSTKKDLFILDESAIKPSTYHYNISISGLSIQGSNGGSIFNLPRMANLYVSDVKSFGFFDYAVTMDCYIDSLFSRCSFQNISKAHVRSIVTGEVSTSTTFEKCYFSQGDIGVLVEPSSTNSLVFNDCIFESLNAVVEQHIDNRVFMYGCYVEKTPMNDTIDDGAFILGVNNGGVVKPGGRFLYSGGVIQGYIGSTVSDYPDNASLIKTYDIGSVTFVGTDISRFKYLMEQNNEKTFTSFVSVRGANVSNYGKKVNWDRVSILGSNFDHILFEGEVVSSVSPIMVDNIRFSGSNSQVIGNSKLFKDEQTERVSFKDSEGKVYRLGNKSVQDNVNFTGLGKVQKGEIVFNDLNHELGEPAGYVARDFSKDVESLIITGVTTIDSNVIKSSTSTNPFWSFKVGDYVFFDKGFTENKAYQIIAKSLDNSTISVDSTALTSQTNVSVRTLSHKVSLRPFGQIGQRRNFGSPVGVLTPKFMGEEMFDFSGNNWFKSTGTTNQDWKQMTQ